MRPRPLAALLVLLLAAGGARAEMLAIRAGDQPRLSRLVLDLPPATSWSMVQAGRDVTLRFPGVALDFDTTEIFPGRRASRLLAARIRAESTGTVLVLTLACDCAADAFALGPRKLVMDVRDIGTPPGLDPAPDPARAPPPPPAVPPPAPPATEAEAIAAARARLLDRLARAAGQDLVALAPPPGAPDGLPPGPVAPAPDLVPPPGAVPAPEIEAYTARDRDRAAREALPVRADCPSETLLDVAAWGGAAPVATQIAEARAALLGEFDRPDPAATLRLARLYVHYGFGRETLALLEGADLPGPGPRLLADLARLVEGRAPAPDGPLAAAAGCPGRAALWGFLAGIDRRDFRAALPAQPLLPAIETAFAELPTAPRRLVGPALARALLGQGLVAAAGRILALAGRAPGDPGEAWHLARAALLEAEGDPQAAEAIWAALVAADREGASEAMIAWTESRIARGLPPPPRIAEDLAARQRTDAAVTALRMAEIEALAASGDLRAALDALATDLARTPDRAAELRAAAARILARARAETVGPAAYAAALLVRADLLAAERSADPARLAAATELSGIGLPNAALRLLAPALARGEAPVRLAAAAAELALGRPEAAQALLEGLDGPDAALLRAKVLARQGDFRAALAELDRGGVPDEARARLAFAGGLWSEALAADDPLERVMAAYMAGPAAPPAPAPAAGTADPALPDPYRAFLAAPRPDAPVTLGLARETIDIARATRELLAGRLARPAP